MNIHEYQAKEVLRAYGVATLKGTMATNTEDAVKAAKDMGGSIWVVKAQIHAGGRGKAAVLNWPNPWTRLKICLETSWA